DLRKIDAICGDLLNMAERDGLRVLVLSEYGITQVSSAVHINRILRERGFLKVRVERGLELLDAGASQAFAVADHQVAHVYIQDPSVQRVVHTLLEQTEGIEAVWDKLEQQKRNIWHARSGELMAMTSADRWFSYYYFLDDARAPDFARTVDIHKKPGYDPVELFLDPGLLFGKLSVAAKLAKRKLGFRGLLDVIPLDDTLVRGSHGRPTDDPKCGPVLISSERALLEHSPDLVPATSVRDLILAHLFDSE